MKRPLSWVAALAALLTIVSACSHTVESPVPKDGALDPDLVCNDTLVDEKGVEQVPAFSTVNIHGQNLTPMPNKTLDNKKPPKEELKLPQIALDRTMEIPGMGAPAGMPSVIVKDDPADPSLSRVHWFSEQLMAFDIKKEDNFSTGVFTITVTNPDGLYADAPAPNDVVTKTVITKALAVLPPPIITTLMPPAICDDQSDQKITINGAYFLTFDDKVPTVLVGDRSYTPVVDDATCAALDGKFKESNVRVWDPLESTCRHASLSIL